MCYYTTLDSTAESDTLLDTCLRVGTPLMMPFFVSVTLVREFVSLNELKLEYHFAACILQNHFLKAKNLYLSAFFS